MYHVPKLFQVHHLTKFQTDSQNNSNKNIPCPNKALPIQSINYTYIIKDKPNRERRGHQQRKVQALDMLHVDKSPRTQSRYKKRGAITPLKYCFTENCNNGVRK